MKLGNGLLGLVLLGSGQVCAGVEVPLEMLAGRYLLVGQGVGGRTFSDEIWITSDGELLYLESCAMGPGGLAPAEGPDDIPIWRGDFAEQSVGCEVFVDLANYPVFVCWSDAGGRMAFFPEGERFGVRPSCLP